MFQINFYGFSGPAEGYVFEDYFKQPLPEKFESAESALLWAKKNYKGADEYGIDAIFEIEEA